MVNPPIITADEAKQIELPPPKIIDLPGQLLNELTFNALSDAVVSPCPLKLAIILPNPYKLFPRYPPLPSFVINKLDDVIPDTVFPKTI